MGGNTYKFCILPFPKPEIIYRALDLKVCEQLWIVHQCLTKHPSKLQTLTECGAVLANHL